MNKKRVGTYDRDSEEGGPDETSAMWRDPVSLSPCTLSVH